MKEGGAASENVHRSPNGIFEREVVLGSDRFRHRNFVEAAAYSPDGRWIVSGDWGGEIRVWEAETGRRIAAWSLDSRPVQILAIAIAPDSRRMAVAGGDRTLQVREIPSGRLLALRKDLEAPLHNLAFPPDGCRILSTDCQQSVRLWDLSKEDMACLWEGRQVKAWPMVLTPDGTTALSGGGDGTLAIWEIATGKTLATIKAHEKGVYALAVFPDGRRALTGSEDGAIRLWDLAEKRRIAEWRKSGSGVTSLAIAPDGRRVLSADYSGEVTLWNADHGTALPTPAVAETYQQGPDVAISPDGRRALIPSSQMFRVWNLDPFEEAFPEKGHRRSVGALAFGPDGSTVLSAERDGRILRWDASVGAVTDEWPGLDADPVALAASPDGRRILSRWEDRSIDIFDAESGKAIWTFDEIEPDGEGVTACAVSPDGVLVAEGRADGTLTLTVAGTRTVLARWPPAPAPKSEEPDRGDIRISDVVFSADGRFVLSKSGRDRIVLWDVEARRTRAAWVEQPDLQDGMIMLWNKIRALSEVGPETVRLRQALPGRSMSVWNGPLRLRHAPVFSSDGSRVLVDEHLWDTETGTELAEWEGCGTADQAFCPDGRHAVAVGDGALQLWDVRLGIEIDAIAVPGGPKALAVRRDRIAVANEDTTITLYRFRCPPGEDVPPGGRGREIAASLRGPLVRERILGSDRLRNRKEVSALVFAPDGYRALSAGNGPEIRVWDMRTGNTIAVWRGHSAVGNWHAHASDVSALAVTKDGRRVVSGGRDGTVRVWSFPDGACLTTLAAEGPVTAAAVSPDGRWIAAVGEEGLKVWEAGTGRSPWKREECANTRALAFSPDGSLLAACVDSQRIVVWESGTGQEVGTCSDPVRVVDAIAFLPDGRRFLSGDSTGLVLWDVSRSKALEEWEGDGWNEVLAVSPDGKRAVSGGQGGDIEFWDVETGKRVATSTGHHWVTAVAYSPDGTKILSGDFIGVLKLWDASTGREIPLTAAHADTVVSVDIDPAGRRLLSGSAEGTIKLWSRDSGRCLWTREDEPLLDSVAFSPDGKRAVSGGNDGVISLWNVDTGQRVAQWQGAKDWNLMSLAWEPDGRHILAVAWGLWMTRWDVQSGREVGPGWQMTRLGWEHSPGCIALTTDRRKILGQGPGGDPERGHSLALFEIGNDEPLWSVRGNNHEINTVAISRDMSRAISESMGIFKLWDVGSKRQLASWKTPRYAQFVTFSDDGRYAVSGSYEDASVDVRVLARPEAGHPFRTTGVPQCVAVRGDLVVIGNENGTIDVCRLVR